jgi:CubicO group peptidase (beta-lactamase class C family)
MNDRLQRTLTAALTKTPGLCCLVLDSTGVVFEHDGGWADLRIRTPMTSATTLMAYSMSKTITAAAVMRLVQDQKIGLDVPVIEYVGPLPYDERITVRHLLSHTSGIPNPIPLRWVHVAAEHRQFDEKAALDAVLAAHPRSSFCPGSKYAYSNIGYWLLGRAVERVIGQPFTTSVTNYVLLPLGASSSELAYVVPDPSRHATGYLEKYSWLNVAKHFLIAPQFIGSYTGAWLEIKSHYVNGASFGGLVGTARGFCRFLRDQLVPKSAIFEDSTRRAFFEQQRTTYGAQVPMTLGWHVGDRGGRPYFYKEGGGGGFHSLMHLHEPCGLASVVMTNATGFDVHGFLHALDDQFVR